MDGLCGSRNLVIVDGFLSQCFVEAVLFPACLVVTTAVVLWALWQSRGRRLRRKQSGHLGAALLLLVLLAILPLCEVGVLWGVRRLDSGSVLLRTASAAVAAVLLALACVLHRPTAAVLTSAVLLFGATALLLQIRVWAAAWLQVGLLGAQLTVIFGAVGALWYALESFADGAEEPEPERARLLLSVQEGRAVAPVVPTMVGSPEEEASLVSRVIFWWTGGLMSLGSRWGSRLALQMENIWPLARDDRAAAVVERLEECGAEQQPRLLWLLVRMFGAEFAVAGLIKLINDTCVFAGPLFLTLVLFFLDTPEWPLWLGCVLALGMFFGAVLQTVAINHYFFVLYRLGIRSRSALGHVLLAKLFRVQRSAGAHSLGALTTLLSVDAGRPLAAAPYLHIVWSAPLQIGVAMYLLYGQLGLAAFAGLGVIVLLLPVNFVLAKGMGAVQERLMKCKDARMAKIVEVFQGIRVLKYFVWEDLFEGQVRSLRENELRELRKFNVYNAISSFGWLCSPVIVALVTFSVYTVLGHDLTPSIAFSSVALFNVLRFPLNVLPSVVSSIVELRVSLSRMQAFLDTPERAPYLSPPQHPGACIEMTGATFAWPEAAGPTLTEASFALERGKIGAVSSLLAALLGDMQLRGGHVALEGSVAFVAQTPWIQNCSLRDNILFGLPLDVDRYARVLDACQLRPDLDTLPHGDRTEIGEKGVNLSGGQKQRVALARAVYADKQVYLLDDVLSAVDVHVGRAIFEGVLRGLLRGKTVLVVTHQLQYLPDVDVVVFLADSRVAECGSFAQLMAARGAFSRLIDEYGHERPVSDSAKAEGGVVSLAKNTAEAVLPSDDEKSEAEEEGRLVMAEQRELGKVKGSVFWSYLSHIGVVAGLLLAMSLLLETGGSFASQYWLGVWTSEDSASITHSSLFWIGFYCLLGGVAALGSLAAGLLVAFSAIRASRALHEKLVARLVHAPISFFDQTPTGRILNRCSSDIDQIDEQLPDTLSAIASMVVGSAGTLVTISIISPLFLVLIFPILFLYRYIERRYLVVSREIKRLESVSKSPLLAMLSETFNGLTTIRAFSAETQFLERNKLLLDGSMRAVFAGYTCNRWLSMRIETVGNAVLLATTMLAVLTRGSVAVGLAGVSITSSLLLAGSLAWLVRLRTLLETQMVATERVLDYSAVVQDAPRHAAPLHVSRGELEFRDVCFSYRRGLPLVLDHVSFRVEPGQRVGIVGRTGAGKSSLLLALFRFVEAVAGQIFIDGTDIAACGTDALRSAITIIPQEPTLFGSSLRFNLDPVGTASDADLWRVLAQVRLADKARALEGQLAHICAEGSFSAGERQLVCFARALLRRAKIIVMDEVSANVDAETDAIVQQLIQEAFQESTVLLIAHRLQSVQACDKILVLARGRVAQYGTPAELLADTRGEFYGMAREK